MKLQQRIQGIQSRIAQAAVRSGRKPQDVTLLAVSKTVPVEILQEAYDIGLRQFGENRVQEALPKIEALPSDIQWHLIGRLQSNKINKVVGKFALIHSVDSIELAKDLSQRAGDTFLEVLLEVNASGEASKVGVLPKDAETVARSIVQLPNLKLKGLMTIGPLTDDEDVLRDSFKRLKVLFDGIRDKEGLRDSFSVLSMGMSGDFEMAIEEGSTLVRIGTAIFGERG